MTQYNLGFICREFYEENVGGWGLQQINLDNLKAMIENVSWTQSEPVIGRIGQNGSINTMRGATTQAQFSKGQNNRDLNVVINITAKSDYSPTVRIYLQKGLVKGLKDPNNELDLNLDPAIQNRFVASVKIDPSKTFKEARIPKQSKVQTSSNNMGREVVSTAEVSSYQEAYSGRFTCDMVLRGPVVFVAQGVAQQQAISEIMRGRTGTRISGQDVRWKMEGECELRKDAEPQIRWL